MCFFFFFLNAYAFFSLCTGSLCLSLYWRGCPLQLVRTIQIPNFLEGNYDIYNANPCNSP